MPFGYDSQRVLKPSFPHIFPKLFPVDSAVVDFHVTVGQMNFAGPDAAVELAERGRIFTSIYRLARRPRVRKTVADNMCTT